MAWDNETITTMGIISSEVYADKGQKYFEDLPDNPDGSKNYQVLVANGTTYKVLDHTPDATATGFQALLLQSGNNYVVAFRGTEPASLLDWFNNAQVGFNNFSTQKFRVSP